MHVSRHGISVVCNEATAIRRACYKLGVLLSEFTFICKGIKVGTSWTETYLINLDLFSTCLPIYLEESSNADLHSALILFR